MEQFTYIYKQGALCGTARAARTIGPRPPAGYGYPEKTAGVPCRRRACPRSSHPARPPLRRITPPAPAGTNACSVPVKYWKRRCRLCCVLFGHSGRSTPQAANSGAGGCAPGHPDTESDRSTARARKAADEAEAMAATELRRRQKHRPHPKRCENHASCRKAKFFSYFCAIIIGKR